MNLAHGFRIGDWDVLPLEGRIVQSSAADEGPADAEWRRVRRKAMDVLCVLAERAGQVVERDELLSAVWGRTAVTDEPLTSTIGELRRLLGERQGAERRYIETIPKRGYRLLAEVEPLPAPASPEKPSAPPWERSPDRDVSPWERSPDRDSSPPAQPWERSPDRDSSPPPGPPPQRPRVAPSIRLDLRALVVLIGIAAFLGFAVHRAMTPTETPVPPRSIAVLPFEDMSPEGNQGYFADGLAEELISLLTRRPPLRVAARDSAFAFRGRNLSPAEVAERLKVAHVLTGSVRQQGERVRVTTQLIDAKAGYQIWANSYDRTLSDIFAIQDEIAGEVAQQLSRHLLGAAPKVRETDPRAYTLYLQARHVGRQHTQDGLTQAVDLYRRALAIDDQYLPAWNELAGVYLNLAGFALMPREDAFRHAREAAYRALAVDPDFAPAHDRLGWLALLHDNDFAGAAEHYRRALALEPGNDAIRSNAAVLAVALGRLDEAIALLEGVVVRDPVSAISHANLANAYLLARRYAEAERSIRDALTLSPQYAGAHYRLGRVLLARNDVAGARDAFAAEPVEVARLLGEALVSNATGQFAESDAALERVRADWGDLAAGNFAQVYAQRGDVEQALRWLEVEARTNGASGFLEYRLDPLFDVLRQDPRWPGLLERFGFAAEDLARVQFPSPDELAADRYGRPSRG